ncbi:NADH pyrophosphatase [Ventosimonas gracilis]|uniref:NAD-capped RNA hydrolase NudC n=1 Tax=Ventosimonas gracilis TaxID=1680762 RepID=A0A139SS24_9GAMM|nr:NAD(+) diphosphatase [Ventosimonas gracilis]KXU37280.1 NADH pyrophosphatase [Ventosimonas gracilis]
MPIWRSAPPFAAEANGYLLRSEQGFLAAPHGLLFAPHSLDPSLGILGKHHLGFFDEKPVGLLLIDEPKKLPCGQWQSLRTLMQQSDSATFQMLSFAEQVAHWHFAHQFCGRCGAKNKQVPGERCMRCPACGLDSYARISPSMIVLVTRGDKILLARSPRFVPGVYSTLAGFAEPAETIEQCVVREVREEVALEITNLRYLGSQSWPFPHSLMLGFHAEYLSGEICIQADEIEDAKWFSLDKLPKLPMPQSIARQLIERYLREYQPK